MLWCSDFSWSLPAWSMSGNDRRGYKLSVAQKQVFMVATTGLKLQALEASGWTSCAEPAGVGGGVPERRVPDQGLGEAGEDVRQRAWVCDEECARGCTCLSISVTKI